MPITLSVDEINQTSSRNLIEEVAHTDRKLNVADPGGVVAVAHRIEEDR